jgi:cation transport regulator ChaC
VRRVGFPPPNHTAAGNHRGEVRCRGQRAIVERNHALSKPGYHRCLRSVSRLVQRFRPTLRRLITRSWLLSRCYYRYQGACLRGQPRQEIWYFAYGANMDESTFRVRRRIRPLECRAGCLTGYRLRFNLDGRPKGRSAPANLCPDPDAEVWGVLYRITRRDLMLLDATEGVPGGGYRHIEIKVEDRDGRAVHAITYMARGNEMDGKPSLRYITLIRGGARAHGLPEYYIRFLEAVEHVQ